jgi:hypothetical protein
LQSDTQIFCFSMMLNHFLPIHFATLHAKGVISM